MSANNESIRSSKERQGFVGISPDEAVARKVAAIENEMLEAYAAAFLKYTGLRPDQCELQRRITPDGVSFRFVAVDPAP